MINASKNALSKSDGLNVSKVLSNYNEIPSIRKQSSNYVDPYKDKTNEFIRPRMFAPEEEVDKNMIRNWVKDTINRPVPPRATVLLRTNGFADQDLENRESFHCAMGQVLCVTQFFGMLPLAGVTSKSPKDLVFNVFYPRTIYAIVISLLLMLMFISAIANVIHQYDPTSAKSYTGDGFGIGVWVIFFYGNAFLSAIFFIRLAPRWINIQRDWSEMERLLDRGMVEPTRLRCKFALITATITSFALLEHVMGLLAGPPIKFMLSSSEVTFNSVIHSVCQSTHPYILTIVNYNLATGISIIGINTLAGFGWNFMDLFIILVSVGLGERYKTLNKKVTHEVSKSPNNINWNELRESYAALSKLVKNVDDHVSPIILLSFFNNVYFTCLQLLKILSLKISPLDLAYYIGSFAFVFGKTISVTLLAAQINIQSNGALSDIYICPESAYNNETRRLQQQLSSDQVLLTGMKFFAITRNLLLAVTGTIVTYEVLLLNTMH